MADETIYDKRRPGYPVKSIDETSYRTTIEYVGLETELLAAAPNLGDIWGEYIGFVTASDIQPLETSTWAILVVTCEQKLGGGGAEMGDGALDTTTTEIDWVTVQRPMYEHPAFAVGLGGDYELTSEDIINIQKWQTMTNTEYKADFIYVVGDPASWDGGSGGTETLSTNAKMFAQGIILGIEHYEDFAPIARKSETYRGGPGPTGSAGQKEDPDGIPNLPAGYEWVRSADRSLHTGGQTRWQRDIEWSGMKKCLVDVDQILWDAPA